MNYLEAIQDLLPPIYSVAGDAVLTQLLSAVALELEAYEEDVERMRRTHWVEWAYALGDLDKIAALMGIERLPWETLPLFRERLLAQIAAQLRGALGPDEIKAFVYSYLIGAEQALSGDLSLGPGAAERTTFVPGLQQSAATELAARVREAFAAPATAAQRKLALVENPHRTRRSPTLAATNGHVPYLFRWTEYNRGLAETVAMFEIGGLAHGRTSVPVVVNLTTGDMLGFRGLLRQGRTLVLRSSDPDSASRVPVATIDGRDVGASLFSMGGFRLGVPFEPADLDAAPQLPRLARGANEWLFLSVGLYDVKGLNSFFFALADDRLREGVFDQTEYDHALFPSGSVAKLGLQWVETEPASFEVQVPRYIVVERGGSGGDAERPYLLVGDALRRSVGELRAAGVRAEVRFVPFVEQQRQTARANFSWQQLDPERGPTGQGDRISLGGRFGESPLVDARFE